MTVAYYTDDAHHSDGGRGARSRSFAGGWISWGLLSAIAIALGLLAAVPSDYVIEKPGPTFDTLGTIEVEGDPVPLIDIPGQQTYPTTGSLTMLTVSTFGDREYPATWFDVAFAALDPSQDAVALDLAFPDGQSSDESAEISAAQMRESQQAAIAAALATAGYEYSTELSVLATVEGSPSRELLLEGDIILSANGVEVADAAELRAAIAENGTEKPVTISVDRDGVPTDVPITPVLSDAETPEPIIGVHLAVEYLFPFEVSVQLSEIGGPSAGQIFALAIIDKLTPGSLNGGLAVAGTGTITAEGIIGPIGGVTQKLYGAKAAGAHYFLLPAANCAALAAANVPDDLDIYAVETLADSLNVLSTLASGAGTSLLPRCPAP